MVRPVGKRYSLPWEEGESVVPSRIRRFSREKQVQLIAEWFFSLYEDPANETPYDGREGGYQYIHGGPYDAREAIEAEFKAVVDEDVIDKAIDFVERDGTLEWAPSPKHPDYIAYDGEPESSRDEANRFFDFEAGFERSPVGFPNLGEGVFYSVPWDRELKVSPSEVRSLTPQRQHELIEHWFYQMFEALSDGQITPAENHGDPLDRGRTYKARDAILNEFIEIADQGVILDVISKVHNTGGTVWGPGRLHPDRMGLEFGGETAASFFETNKPFGQPNRPPFGERDLIADHEQIDARLERGARSSFGSSYDRAVRQTFQKHAADLRALLERPAVAPAQHGGIGHNQPPSDIALDKEHSDQLKGAVETISEELKLERPDVRKVSRAARVLQSIGIWVAKKLDMTVDAFMKSVGSTLGISAAGAVAAVGLLGIDAIIQKVMEIYQLIINWLNAVVLPL